MKFQVSDTQITVPSLQLSELDKTVNSSFAAPLALTRAGGGYALERPSQYRPTPQKSRESVNPFLR